MINWKGSRYTIILIDLRFYNATIIGLLHLYYTYRFLYYFIFDEMKTVVNWVVLFFLSQKICNTLIDNNTAYVLWVFKSKCK